MGGLGDRSYKIITPARNGGKLMAGIARLLSLFSLGILSFNIVLPRNGGRLGTGIPLFLSLVFFRISKF